MSRINRFAGEEPDSNWEEEQKLQRIFESAAPEAPALDVDRLLELREQALFRAPEVTSRSASRYWKNVALSTAGSVVVVVSIFLLIRAVPEKTAFADVQSQVNRLQTVQFTNFMTFTDEATVAPRKLRVKILGRHLQKTEVIGNPGKYALIDSRQGRLFDVDTVKKIFREIKTKVVIDTDSNERMEEELIIPRDIDFYENITGFPENAFERVGSGTVGTRPAEQFQRVYVNRLTTRTVSIWIDPTSRLPLHIEIRMQSKDPQFRQVEYTFTDFIYNEPLDENSFSTEPPQGYQVVDGEFIERK